MRAWCHARGHAGTGIAKPAALLRAALSMLVRIRQADMAMREQDAGLHTLEGGVFAADPMAPCGCASGARRAA
ncbi:MAG: hypothetical protein ACK57B_07140 [Betaproteobacteria bacterium]